MGIKSKSYKDQPNERMPVRTCVNVTIFLIVCVVFILSTTLFLLVQFTTKVLCVRVGMKKTKSVGQPQGILSCEYFYCVRNVLFYTLSCIIMNVLKVGNVITTWKEWIVPSHELDSLSWHGFRSQFLQQRHDSYLKFVFYWFFYVV